MAIETVLDLIASQLLQSVPELGATVGTRVYDPNSPDPVVQMKAKDPLWGNLVDDVKQGKWLPLADSVYLPQGHAKGSLVRPVHKVSRPNTGLDPYTIYAINHVRNEVVKKFEKQIEMERKVAKDPSFWESILNSIGWVGF